MSITFKLFSSAFLVIFRFPPPWNYPVWADQWRVTTPFPVILTRYRTCSNTLSYSGTCIIISWLTCTLLASVEPKWLSAPQRSLPAPGSLLLKTRYLQSSSEEGTQRANSSERRLGESAPNLCNKKTLPIIIASCTKYSSTFFKTLHQFRNICEPYKTQLLAKPLTLCQGQVFEPAFWFEYIYFAALFNFVLFPQANNQQNVSCITYKYLT